MSSPRHSIRSEILKKRKHERGSSSRRCVLVLSFARKGNDRYGSLYVVLEVDDVVTNVAQLPEAATTMMVPFIHAW
jgi:hypothetical protein